LFKSSKEHDWTERTEIVELPSVLFMCLKRFDQASASSSPTKLDTEFAYDESLDMAEFAPEIGGSNVPTRYTLYGVCVHRGEASQGYHFCILRPTVDDKWFAFDDDIIIPLLRRHVFDDYKAVDYACSFGVAARQRKMYEAKRFANAHMLIYVRDSELKRILGQDDNTTRSAQSGSTPKN
ncbi:ubiquitin-specific protease ubp15, partial [Linderina pennispora]